MRDPIRFHLSLNVADLEKSVAFFRTLFGAEPARLRPDYAKFEPADPPLVISLQPAPAVGGGGALNHLGFRLPDASSLTAMQDRIERAGLRTTSEVGVECCHSRQTKFWVHDPDGNLWEVYTYDGDVEDCGARQTPAAAVHTIAAPAVVAWEHRLGEPLPAQIPLADGSANEVRLRGTLNLPQSVDRQRQLVAEVMRVLTPGGRLFVHVLAGDRLIDTPDLPGPAGAVRTVPFEADPVDLLFEAGLVGVRLLKLEAKPCFVRNGVAMREMQLEGFAPVAPTGATVDVMYRGPFREVNDDEGRVYTRGHRVSVPTAIAARFRTGEMTSQFTIFDSTANHP